MNPPKPPTVSASAWPESQLDHFILERLESAQLDPAPPATRTEFIRRVTFDLIGLPPTPEEIDAYLADPSPSAETTLIDRLLASPRYGERWGRHWLDLARFGETDGFEHDAVRPNAWRYRDYVIRSFNSDKPYDRFVREQIAGDLLHPDDPDALIATGFNLLGPDMVDSSDQIRRRHDTLNDMTDTTGLVFLGLTVGCARCHDHKLEPITQEDYYSLQAFFTPATFQPKLDIATSQQKSAHEEATREYRVLKRPFEEAIAAIESPYRARLHEEKLSALPEEARAAHATDEERRTPEQARLVESTGSRLVVEANDVIKALSPEERRHHQELKTQLGRIAAPPPLPQALGLKEGKPDKTFVLLRGDYTSPREEAQPRYPAVLPQTPGATSRLALAEWIASPQNPLTARVMANRIWQHHFGRGIVASTSDFGFQGQPPTHPALLDWLALEFVRSGWSVKALHKRILLSATYRQSTRASARTLELDPDNRLHSRRTRVRLEGEVIRDSLLAISGQLNRDMGGPGVFPPIPANLFEGASGWTVSKVPADHHRRSIYIFARRNLRFPFLEVFDAPDSNLSCAERGRSTSAPQSLTLLNADTVVSAAHLTAQQARASTTSDDECITLLFRQILGRPPGEQELLRSREFLESSPLPELCRALFNLNSFIYVD